MHNILAVNNIIPNSCKTVLLTGQQFHQSITRYQTVDQWLYFHWFNKSRDIDVTMSMTDEEIENICASFFESG